ncbi:MAG: transcriptional repressor [Pseudomonadota bacterium]
MTGSCPNDAKTPCAPTNRHTFIEHAAALVEQRGQRLTPIRRKVLELLLDSSNPAKAYDLLDKLDGQGAAKPPTVYRALDFLQSMGLAHKIESLNAFVACGHAGHNHSAIFLICDACGGAEELHADATSKALNSETANAGFKLDHSIIEARGICRRCQT